MELLTAHLPLVAAAGVAGFALLFLLARRLAVSTHEPLDWNRIQAFSPRFYEPMARLLREDDYAFLRSQRGFQSEVADRLRRQRSEIFRGYVNRLDADFRELHRLARIMVLNHEKDSPELVTALVRQSATFRYALLRIRLRLLLHSAGIAPAALRPADISPLLDTARWVQDQIRMMSPQMSSAAA